MCEVTFDFKTAKKAFSTIGFALCAILVIASFLQLLWFMIPELLWGEDNWLTASSWGIWIGTFAPLYCIAIPIGLLIMRKIPAQAPADHKLEARHFWVILPVCFFLMYSGNFVGNFLSSVLSGGNAQNELLDYAMDTNPLKILVMVILAPFLEEYVCRKQIIDRTRQYGEKTAVFLSALTFGLLHQNLFQFFYAFALGLVFAYIYLRTGRLRYPVILHSIINFMGAVIAPWILSLLDYNALTGMDPNAPAEEVLGLYAQNLPGLLVCLLYAFIVGGMAIAGLVLLCAHRKQLIWKVSETPLPPKSGVKTVYLSAGMLLYILLCLSTIILSFI